MLSLTIIWCEGTILLDGEPFNLNLSPLSLLIRWMGLGGGGAAVTLVIFVPLFYCAACTYYAFFNLRLCEGYSIHWNKHSDSSSLLFNATYACRFGSALCFNYLKLIHENETGQDGGLGFYRKAPDGSIITSYFDQTAFGAMDNMPPPFSGDWFDDSCRSSSCCSQAAGTSTSLPLSSGSAANASHASPTARRRPSHSMRTFRTRASSTARPSLCKRSARSPTACRSAPTCSYSPPPPLVRHRDASPRPPSRPSFLVC